MKYKPYLITLASFTPNMPRFLKSLENIDVEYIPVQFFPHYHYDDRYKMSFRYPGNMSRFKFFPTTLNPERYMIFTDTDDVVFQKKLPDFEMLGCNIYVANENVLHKDSYWKQYCETFKMFEILSEKTVYNAGCYAMKVSTFYEWVKFFNAHFDKYFIHQDFDQLLFNIWLLKQKRINSRPDIFATIYNNMDAGIIKKEEGIWKTKDGDVITCVHANGSMKPLL